MQGHRARRRELLPLIDAIVAAGLDPAPWAAPRRLLVLGRVGVGKTSWCNAVSGQHAPVGLGGVTDAVVAHPGEVVLLDAPGLDRPGAAARIAAEAGEIDGVVWIVDGLAPVGEAERRDVATLRGDAPLVVIVSRADLVPADERDDVAARVALRAGVAPVLADLRRGPWPPVPATPVAPRRVRALVAAIDAALAAPPPTEEPAVRRALRDAWHTRVRAAAAANPDADGWRRAVAALPDAFVADLAGWSTTLPPGRPALPTVAHGPRRTAPAQLAQEGDAAVGDWLDAALEAAQAADRARRETLRALRSSFVVDT